MPQTRKLLDPNTANTVKETSVDLKSYLGRLSMNSRLTAFSLAVIISGFTAIAVWLLSDTPSIEILWVALTVLVSSFLLIFTSLEFLIFREINKIYSVFEGIKKKEFKQVKKALRAYTLSPLRGLNRELVSFATRKEAEISELKNIETYRREFLADISHELKTPVFAAQGFIETLLSGAAEDEEVRDKFLKKASKSLDGLKNLVDDLLTLSQIETGVVQMRFSNIDLGILGQEVMEQLEEKARKREISLQWERRSEKNPIVFADPQRIGQVLINLMENAIKYGTPKGNVYLGVESEKDGYTVWVRDDGPGIAGEHLKRIFDRFYVVEKSRNKEIGGSGIGLAIVKNIIENHHSKINVVSKLGKGTTFTFRLKKGRTEVMNPPGTGSKERENQALAGSLPT